LLTAAFVGHRYVRLEYIVYYERQPFRFWFEFYRPGERWFVTVTGGTDNVSELATEMTKTKLLNMDR
jgi:hypothetical protein